MASNVVLDRIAPPFIDIAHRIVWATVATVDAHGRPRSRILHPIWEWDGTTLVGWVGTGPTPVKRANLEHSPYASCAYWDPSQDTVTADCHAELLFDDETRRAVWERFETAPPPVGYDPRLIEPWTSPTADAFAVLRLDPWRLRVFPGAALGGGAEVLDWRDDA